MTLIEYASQFVGKQETKGSNRGPLVDSWKGLVSTGLLTTSIPWCACFVFAMLCERNGLDKKKLAKALGFTGAGTWYPESTQSWFDQAKASARLTPTPRAGDLFLLMKQNQKGEFLAGQPHHIGFYASPTPLPAPKGLFDTLEGNTVPGTVGGAVSREGDGVYARSRRNLPGAFAFIALPPALVGP